MTRFKTFLVALVAALSLTSPLLAQTTVNSTTTTAAIDRQAQVIPLTAVTNFAINDLAVMDSEFVQVNAVDTVGLTITVRRGVQGSAAHAHVSGVVVWNGPPRRFYTNRETGACTAASEAYLPHIVLPGPGSSFGGDMFDCKNGEWVSLRDNGFRVWNPGRTDGGTTYTAAGAITIQPGVSFINGTTLAMTLAAPTTDQNGMIMIILATNASAHTLTNTAGFGGGTTARDVATFGGAVNDGLVIIAFNGVWWTLSTRNVTFG